MKISWLLRGFDLNMAKSSAKFLKEQDLKELVEENGKNFYTYCEWLEEAMPRALFEELSSEKIFLIAQTLVQFEIQDFFSVIHLKGGAIVLCLDSVDADLKILKQFSSEGIKSYQAHLSKTPLPSAHYGAPLRVASIEFTSEMDETKEPLTSEIKETLWRYFIECNPCQTKEAFENALKKLNSRFILAIPPERLSLAIHLLIEAENSDACWCQIKQEEKWKEKNLASAHLVLAWKNVPRKNFLFHLARVIYRHNLTMKRVNAAYTNSYKAESVLVMAISLHGSQNESAFEATDMEEFLREVKALNYFDQIDQIDECLVSTKMISGDLGNFLRAAVTFIHQGLVHVDPNLYTVHNIEEALCRHPELTSLICQAFEEKFDPKKMSFSGIEETKRRFFDLASQLDTGQEMNDIRRKTILNFCMQFVCHTLKTNFYTSSFTALSFRLDPAYLDTLPIDRSKKFPELPFGIFYICGRHFFGFHIRFKDLSRGGLRTVYIEHLESSLYEKDLIFQECYHLAWTQHKKNKDIPEGGAKGIIFISPLSASELEFPLLTQELEQLKIGKEEIETKVAHLYKEQQLELLYQSQRAFVESLLSLVNCHENGSLRAQNILDYWKRPEYLYLGPDENMHDSMINWIAAYSKKQDYKPGSAFISSKPGLGINHKEYGVTSLGVDVYMREVLEHLGINPLKELFRIKMSGGPDGDVAGNELLNLLKFYPKTAKLVALTDGTGTIRDENGLNLEELKELFFQSKGIAHYSPLLLSEGGFLVKRQKTRQLTPYIQETLCLKKVEGKVVEKWLSGSEASHLFRFNVHKAEADIFIPAGGRPRTLNENNIDEFLNDQKLPTAKAIVEGANLYLSPKARRLLEEKGALIIKDSSANKGGVICSSFEVLAGLVLSDKEFMENKEVLVKEILERIRACSKNEANLLLKTHEQTGDFLTSISEKISDRINQFTYELLDYLDSFPFPRTGVDPLGAIYLSYCPQVLREKFQKELFEKVPDHHKKAIVASFLASKLVYEKGLSWSPSIIDILPLILEETENSAV